MKGFSEQVAAGVPETISLASVVPFTNIRITNESGAVLNVLVDVPASATPSAANAHFTIPDAGGVLFEFDHPAQAMASLRVVSAVQGYVHFIAW